MTKHTTATREALRLAAKATRFTQSEIVEILIRRYLPTLLTDIKTELGDTINNSSVRCLFLAQNTAKHSRRIAVIIRSERQQMGWSIRKTAAAINCHHWNYQRIEAGDSRVCTPNKATMLAIAFESTYLEQQLRAIDWWRGDSVESS
jgi:hypothetical protein